MFARFQRRATEAEVAVAGAILRSSGARAAELLLEQLRRCRRVERRIDGSGLQVAVPWTTQELMVALDQDVTSDSVVVHELRSGRALRFRVHLARGGFFRCLEGEADGPWPRRWSVGNHELSAIPEGSLTLPTRASSEALAGWLGVSMSKTDDLIIRHPAATGATGALEQREAVPLPAEVKELLEVTDGMEVRGWAILGVQDLHVVEFEGRSYWEIAVGIGPTDDRRCLYDPDEGLVLVPSHDARVADLTQVGRSLHDWIALLVDSSVDGR